MEIINVRIPKQDEYNIAVGSGLLEKVGHLLTACVTSNQLFVVTDETVARLYGGNLRAILQGNGFKVQTFVLGCGEQEKSVKNTLYLVDKLIEYGAHRRTTLLALGGGVITDLTGFVASIYMRGIRYVNMPTTLLAQIDAGVGGKTAINLPMAKNIVGAFHHPSLVIIDPSVLLTLPNIEIRNGLAEAIKVAIIGSESLFTFIESNIEGGGQKNPAILKRIIAESVRLKLDLLEPDPYEQDLRRALNFGHTLGHGLESAVGYDQIVHGQAISIGMMAATRLAYDRGLCNFSTAQRIESVFLSTGLPISFDNSVRPRLLRALEKVELIRGGALNVVLPIGIGSTRVVADVTADELCSYI